MSRLLSLPPELRSQIYMVLVDNALSSKQQTIWVHGALESKDDEHQYLLVSAYHGMTCGIDMIARHNGVRIAHPNHKYGPCQWYEYESPALHHPDMRSLISLATSCKLLRIEAWPIIWGRTYIAVQGKVHQVQALLETRVAASLPRGTILVPKGGALPNYNPLAGTFLLIRTLFLVIQNEGKGRGPREMKQIIGLVKHQLPNLRVLLVSLPFTTSLVLTPPAIRLAVEKSSRDIITTLALLPRNLGIGFNCHAQPLAHQILATEQHWAAAEVAVQQFRTILGNVLARTRALTLYRKVEIVLRNAEHTGYLRHAACNHPAAEKCVGCFIF